MKKIVKHENIRAILCLLVCPKDSYVLGSEFNRSSRHPEPIRAKYQIYFVYC